MYIIKCGHARIVQRAYGPFASISIMNLWMESHIPTTARSIAQIPMCDDGISKDNHYAVMLTDPINGISKHAEVDVMDALTGE